MKSLSSFTVIVLFIGMFFWGAIQPVSNLKKNPTGFDISAGTSFNEIVDKVYSAGLIKSKLAFKIFSLLSARANRFQSGGYNFKKPVSVNELTKILVDGPREISATIFPGMTIKEIDERFSELGIIGSNELVDYNFKLSEENFDNLKISYPYLEGAKSLEGFLLPDTYFFYENSGAKIAVKKILDNFSKEVLPFFKKGDNVLNTLIMASFLEKEIPDNNERKVAAGILEKRLKIGMPLQIDATIIYAKCQRFLECEELRKEDYKFDSPYNTYLHLGLTPAPIANPSKDATISALNPVSSQYWYYLSDQKTKKTIFSKDLDEHNINRVKYSLLK